MLRYTRIPLALRVLIISDNLSYHLRLLQIWIVAIPRLMNWKVDRGPPDASRRRKAPLLTPQCIREIAATPINRREGVRSQDGFRAARYVTLPVR